MSVIDIETIDMLQDVLADDFGDLIRVFLDDGRKRINEIKLGIEDSDWLTVEKSAHTFKGSSSNIGALRLSLACDTLVKACRAGLIEEPLGLLANIELELETVQPILISYIE